MEIDIRTVAYDVELTTETGAKYHLNDALLKLRWEEQIGELSQRATLTLANMKIGATYLMALVKINCPITIYGRWNGGNRIAAFQGIVWEWQYVSGTQKELTVTAYDSLIRLQQSQDFKYYSPGMTTHALLSDICNDWGIPLSYQWSQGITHGKMVFHGDKISNIIIEVLEEVRRQTGVKYVVQFRNGSLTVNAYGTNSPVYRFDTESAISTSDKLTINNLVTQVLVYGKADDEEKRPVEWTVDGKKLPNGEHVYGTLRKIVLLNGDQTLDSAKSEAQTILKDYGKPEEVIEITVPDVPFIRKGDKIEVAAGNLLGVFFAVGITHNATEGQMTLDLLRNQNYRSKLQIPAIRLNLKQKRFLRFL